MARTLQEVLDNELSPDKMGDYTPNELADFLVKNGIVENTADVNRIVIEGIQKALIDDDEFPIRYYTKNERRIFEIIKNSKKRRDRRFYKIFGKYRFFYFTCKY